MSSTSLTTQRAESLIRLTYGLINACALLYQLGLLPWRLLLASFLAWRRLRGDLRNAYKYLQGGCQEDGARLFPVVPSDRTRGNGHKLKPRKFQLKTRKNFFPLRVTEPWNRLPRGAVESPSLEIFKTRLDAVLCSLLWVTLLRQGVGLGDPQRSLPTPAMLGFWDSAILQIHPKPPRGFTLSN